MKERDNGIDILRVTGLLCVMFAHVDPPTALLNARSFDVVLLVFVSGMSYTANAQRDNTIKYFKKRLGRLVLPTWKFLCIFFALFELLHIANPMFPQFTVQDYTRSFLFVSGIGYVWIISVYLLMAAAAPVLENLLHRYGLKKFMYMLAVLYATYDIAMRVALYFTSFMGEGIQKLIAIIHVGYIFVYGVGMIIKQMNRKQICILLCSQFILFMILGFVNNFELIFSEKYPPTAYYLSFGLLICVILFLVVEINTKTILTLRTNRIIRWLSENSLWIYLWHIIPVKILVDYNIVYLGSWVLRYLVTIVVAITITIIQKGIYKMWRTLRSCNCQ